MAHVVGGIYALPRGDDDRATRQRLEDGWRRERGAGGKTSLLQRQILAATPELQRRSDAAGCAKVGEPAGEPVLERRAAGVRGGDRRCGGRRKHRRDRRAPAPGELATCAAPREVAVAEAVDDDEDDVFRLGKFRSGQRGEDRMTRLSAAGLDNRGDQIDEAAA